MRSTVAACTVPELLMPLALSSSVSVGSWLVASGPRKLKNSASPGATWPRMHEVVPHSPLVANLYPLVKAGISALAPLQLRPTTSPLVTSATVLPRDSTAKVVRCWQATASG